jgi:hypothetical protein
MQKKPRPLSTLTYGKHLATPFLADVAAEEDAPEMAVRHPG